MVTSVSHKTRVNLKLMTRLNFQLISIRSESDRIAIQLKICRGGGTGGQEGARAGGRVNARAHRQAGGETVSVVRRPGHTEMLGSGRAIQERFESDSRAIRSIRSDSAWLALRFRSDSSATTLPLYNIKV